MEMVWWQYLIISLTSVALGAFMGYFLNRRGVQSERDARERRELRDAVKGLLTEMNANLKLTEKRPEPALLPPLAKDMWDIHKSKILELPLEIQESLYQAYSAIDSVNAVIDTRLACGNRDQGPGAWDTRYENEGKKARERIEEARSYLGKWLKEQK